MAINIKFDANQQYQRDAIDSVIDLFAGQEAVEQAAGESGLVDSDHVFEGFEQLVFGNSLALTPQTLQTNLLRVQDRPLVIESGDAVAAIPKKLRKELSPDDMPLDFSVEMETGTGKTYVYLRTIAELNQKYSFGKFVIVVPSVAIREGVVSSLKLLEEHIRDLYDGLQYDAYVYDSAALNRVRQFATASHLQIMVINIAAFTRESNVINRPTDAMNGYAPIEFLRACRPIVVMDEPQNMETPIRKNAIDDLAPLFRLRYSATHRELQNLVYRLTPVDAYDLRLVKRIGVLSITKDADLNEAFVEIDKINTTPSSVTATAHIHKATAQGTRRTQVTLRKDDDLYELSGARGVYLGWAVEDIHADTGVVEFGNGRRIRAGSSTGDGDDQLMRLQIREAIESHFEKELELERQLRRKVIPAAIKPLTLFFIDKVINYYPADGKLRVWFEDEYESVRNDAKFRSIRSKMPDVDHVHDGYFALTARGVPKDTREGQDTKDATAAFERIMQNKERLLSFDEPLRFIFSHSALSEGWDNPNVFGICNLQDGKSDMRKRQQVGRGLRLPVMANGERCHVDDINLLTVVANEPFAAFADALQKEIEEETDVKFSGRILDVKKDRVQLAVKPEVLQDNVFKELWDRISKRTRYVIEFDSQAVADEAIRRINEMPDLEPIKFRITRSEIKIGAEGLSPTDTRDRGTEEVTGARTLPNVVGELCRRVPLSRATIVKILKGCDNLDQVKFNPSVFIDQVADAIARALYAQVVEKIAYYPTGEHWEASKFIDASQESTVAPIIVDVDHSITDKVICDSNVEKEFALFLDKQQQIPLFLKLPGWFLIPTPMGNYNPDWAFVLEETDGRHVYLVRETKGGDDIEKLRFESEGWKIKCGAEHFSALKVDFAFGSKPGELIKPHIDLSEYKAASHK